MKFKFNSTPIFLMLSSSVSLIFGLKITIDLYKIVRPNPGIKTCAAVHKEKGAVVAISVSEVTGKCIGLTRRSSRLQSTDHGYAEKIQSVLMFKPTHEVEESSYIDWTIPGGLDIGSNLDVFFSPTYGFNGFDMSSFTLYLSEKPLTSLDIHGPVSQSDNVVMKVSAEGAFSSFVCYVNGKMSTSTSADIQDNQTVNIAFLLLKKSVKVLLDGSEKCANDALEFGDNFDTFHVLYFSSTFGSMNLSKIQLNQESRR